VFSPDHPLARGRRVKDYRQRILNVRVMLSLTALAVRAAVASAIARLWEMMTGASCRGLTGDVETTTGLLQMRSCRPRFP